MKGSSPPTAPLVGRAEPNPGPERPRLASAPVLVKLALRWPSAWSQDRGPAAYCIERPLSEAPPKQGFAAKLTKVWRGLGAPLGVAGYPQRLSAP